MAAVGQRQRRAVGAEHRIEIDAFECPGEGREQLAGNVKVELLDIGNLAVTERREFARAQEADFTVTDSLVFGHCLHPPGVTANDERSLTAMCNCRRAS